jgi:hypothetical protein
MQIENRGSLPQGGGRKFIDFKGLVLHKDNFVRFKGYMYLVFIYFCDFIALVESDFSVHVFYIFLKFLN